MQPDDEATESILIVSHRGPVTFRVGDNDNLVARRGGGGLVTALSSLVQSYAVHWIAHALSEGDVEAMSRVDGDWLEEYTGSRKYWLKLAGTPDAVHTAFYNEFANPLLWFVQHQLYGFGMEPTISRRTYEAHRAYVTINQRLADAAVAHCEQVPSDNRMILVHDYQNYYVPGMIRRHRPEARILFFLHIPWPAPGAWSCVPAEWTRNFLSSLLASNIVGFQTHADARSFIECCSRFLDPQEFQANRGKIVFRGRKIYVNVYPISISTEEFDRVVETASVTRSRGAIGGLRPPDGSLIVRIDRTDPSKNIIRGVRAFELMLHEHPELHGRVSMYCHLDPSRQDISEYVSYTAAIQRSIEAVNTKLATGGWLPITMKLHSDFREAVAAYCEYDVLYVNPVADGMNLVAKEGCYVNRRGGVLVLSEQAGAFEQLGDSVIAVNPFDVAQQADALYEAVTMEREERERRSEEMRDVVRDNDVWDWISRQVTDLYNTPRPMQEPAALG